MWYFFMAKASFRGFPDVIKYLIKNGADPLFRNADKKTPKQLARSPEIAELFPKDEDEGGGQNLHAKLIFTDVEFQEDKED
jgi:hypothetical protein